MVNKKIKASSLLETIVAMVILLTVFSISILAIQNVLRSVQIGNKTYGYFLLQEELAKTLKNKQYISEEIQKDNFIITKDISDSPLSEGLLIIDLKIACDSGTVLSTLRETVMKDD
ncbi:MAG TPA: hypothetical protein VK750_06565 [Cytophagaceae bacterium]|jgi:hypothetical protein|nr:hypothetical protein [Cytophagaceae bacterium]